MDVDDIVSFDGPVRGLVFQEPHEDTRAGSRENVKIYQAPDNGAKRAAEKYIELAGDSKEGTPLAWKSARDLGRDLVVAAGVRAWGSGKLVAGERGERFQQPPWSGEPVLGHRDPPRSPRVCQGSPQTWSGCKVP